MLSINDNLVEYQGNHLDLTKHKDRVKVLEYFLEHGQKATGDDLLGHLHGSDVFCRTENELKFLRLSLKRNLQKLREKLGQKFGGHWLKIYKGTYTLRPDVVQQLLAGGRSWR